jgi:hypothetical protein
MLDDTAEFDGFFLVQSGESLFHGEQEGVIQYQELFMNHFTKWGKFMIVQRKLSKRAAKKQ